jgi:predicted extracellular nuclease
MSQFVGKEVQFTTPFYVTNNSKTGQLTIAPRRIFNPTNQALPLSTDYHSILSLNEQGTLTLTNVSGYHRIDERVHNLKVKVNSYNSLSFISGDWRGNTRAEMEKGYNLEAINTRGEHNLLICYMNLEYYLVDNFGTGYGPNSSADHQKQRTKTSQALAKINADIYALVEIQTGQGALAELAADLTKNTGRNFTYINDGSTTDGSYTKSGYIYCTDVVIPHGNMQHNDTYVQNRKKVQGFTEKASGEKFILSVNHFKAKSGSGSGANKDQGDGQGSYNAARVQEAKSIISNYPTYTSTFGDEDFLIVGDLNAYGKEDPITTLTDWGMIDLHRTFHADSSYSYVYQGTLGYLDHALCNSTLYPQVTGMTPYHINAPEKDTYTYDGSSNDGTMFRCSDHDPILIGLRLGKDNTTTDITSPTYAFYYNHAIRAIENAQGGTYTIYNIDGTIVTQEYITSATHPLPSLAQGIYILTIHKNGQRQSLKLLEL